MEQRLSKDEYYLQIASSVSLRGTCLRRGFGAVIVNHDQIVSTGYAGAPRGAVNCLDVGECPRQKANIPRGERYELCRSVHAEMNAIIHAARPDMVGGTLYLAGFERDTQAAVENAEPCKLCKRMIINAGLSRVVVRQSKDKIQSIEVDRWVKEENLDLADPASRGY